MDEVAEVLKFVGIKRSKPTQLRIVAEQGLNKKALKWLMKNSKLPSKYIFRYLGISAQAFSRKMDTAKLRVPVSDRVLDLAQLYVHGISALDTLENFNLWLETSLPVLEGRKSIDLILSNQGVKVVDEMLLRIENGMFV
ncbi:MAG TPA: hypothetical protein VL443_20705 [Cyclobacteriaceae bacterium]|jgi:putative toxin-antitoxin system antitoxin component (TIGR02293 family)|nr:hypothetical protein [Cyclobacteriaceae bacterium]